MDREEILKKAQSANPGRPDEMELQILQTGSRFGMGIGMLVCVVLINVNSRCLYLCLQKSMM